MEYIYATSERDAGGSVRRRAWVKAPVSYNLPAAVVVWWPDR